MNVYRAYRDSARESTSYDARMSSCTYSSHPSMSFSLVLSSMLISLSAPVDIGSARIVKEGICLTYPQVQDGLTEVEIGSTAQPFSRVYDKTV